MDKKQVENLVLIGLILAIIGIFILSPAYPFSQFDIALNRFLDNYLFGSGYYKPSNYPFAAKITNIFSMIIMMVGGFVMGIYCWKELNISKISPPSLFLFIFIISFLFIYMLYESITPQEFKIPKGRNFWFTESFHNNPISFLFIILCKGFITYGWFRVIPPLILRSLKKLQK